MIILDTDALGQRDPVEVPIEAGLADGPDLDIRITVISTYEIMGGAVTLIERRKKDRRDLVPAFHLHQNLVEYLGLWRGLILPYDAMAEHIFRAFPSRLRQELNDDARIAAVALAARRGGLDL